MLSYFSLLLLVIAFSSQATDLVPPLLEESKNFRPSIFEVKSLEAGERVRISHYVQLDGFKTKVYTDGIFRKFNSSRGDGVIVLEAMNDEFRPIKDARNIIIKLNNIVQSESYSYFSRSLERKNFEGRRYNFEMEQQFNNKRLISTYTEYRSFLTHLVQTLRVVKGFEEFPRFVFDEILKDIRELGIKESMYYEDAKGRLSTEKGNYTRNQFEKLSEGIRRIRAHLAKLLVIDRLMSKSTSSNPSLSYLKSSELARYMDFYIHDISLERFEDERNRLIKNLSDKELQKIIEKVDRLYLEKFGRSMKAILEDKQSMMNDLITKRLYQERKAGRFRSFRFRK